MGLWPLACWDCGFETRRWHWCLSLEIVVYCQVKISGTGWSPVQRCPTQCGMLECDLIASTVRRPWPTGGLLCQEKINNKEWDMCVTGYWNAFGTVDPGPFSVANSTKSRALHFYLVDNCSSYCCYQDLISYFVEKLMTFMSLILPGWSRQSDFLPRRNIL
jgi:hypothetical protein